MNTQASHRRQRDRTGYVLVMALVVIGVTGLVLGRLATRSLALTTEARRGELELQQRWAVLSCQTQILRDPEQVFGDLAASFEQQAVGWPHPGRVRGACVLGGVELALLLDDEQSKANLNVLYDRRPELVPGLLADAAFATGADVPLRIRPAADPASKRSGRHFTSWGRLVNVPRLGEPKRLISIATEFTCWGARQLNVTRASDAALEAITRIELTGPETQQLIESREGFEGAVSDLLEIAEVPRRKAIRLTRVLTDRSQTHSLWIVTGAGELRVTVADSSGSPVSKTYAWP